MIKVVERIASKMECDVFKGFINDLQETLTEAPKPLETIREHRNPFQYMKMDDNSFLNDVDGRSPCPKCFKSRKFFCYTCYVPTKSVGPLLPVVKLPLKIDIIKHRKEIDGKSTAIHAAILSAADVSIYTYPNIPNYENERDTTVLIFPSHDCTNVHGIFNNQVKLEREASSLKPEGYNEGTLLTYRLNEIENGEHGEKARRQRFTKDNLPIKRAVFIDSTWNQCRGIYKDPRINSLQSVVLQHRLSQFWRHQKNSPRWYLATVEAIHQFLLEVHVNAWGVNASYHGLDALEVDMDFLKHNVIEAVGGTDRNDNANLATAPYDGQYDNLLFFFTHMYNLIHTYYDHNDLKAYRRPRC